MMLRRSPARVPVATATEPERQGEANAARATISVTVASLLPFGRTGIAVQSPTVNPMLPFRVNTGRSRRRDPFPSPHLRICGRMSTSPPGRSTPARPGSAACQGSLINSQSGFAATGTCAGHAASGCPGQGTAGQANPADPPPPERSGGPRPRPKPWPPQASSEASPPGKPSGPYRLPTAFHLATADVLDLAAAPNPATPSTPWS